MSNPELKDIDELVERLGQLESMRTSGNTFNLQDLTDWLLDAHELQAIASEVRNQLVKAYEYHAEIDLKLLQQEYNHEIEKATVAAVANSKA